MMIVLFSIKLINCYLLVHTLRIQPDNVYLFCTDMFENIAKSRDFNNNKKRYFNPVINIL